MVNSMFEIILIYYDLTHMKKIAFLIVFILLCCTIQQAFCQYPIPSYNVQVTGWAVFKDGGIIPGSNNVINLNKNRIFSSLAKRTMDIKFNCPGTTLMGNCQATVWVYSLDGTTILGPFYVNGGDVLSVPIDDRDWGVVVKSDDDVSVDVWIE
jgi:hypothetical protein